MRRVLLAFTMLLMPIAAEAQAGPAVVAQPNVSTERARELVAWAVARATAQNMPICVAVADADGHLLAFERMQGAYAGCVDASIAKARSSALFNISTKDFYDMVREKNLGIGFIPGILPAVAGVPLRQGKAVVGTVGVSGDTDVTEQTLAAETAAQFR